VGREGESNCALSQPGGLQRKAGRVQGDREAVGRANELSMNVWLIIQSVVVGLLVVIAMKKIKRPAPPISVADRVRANWFTHNLERPELWGWPLVCPGCGWRVSPAGPWRRIDAMFPPNRCPHCSGRLYLVRQRCPQCTTPFPRLRWPVNRRQALWGGNTCRRCGCEIDRWGRRVGVIEN
jgi:hypothetical protein